jgi:hypothetical protein
MTNPEDVARLREIKRLLDRIQQLPNIAGMPANGALNGFHPEPPRPPPPALALAPDPELDLDPDPTTERPVLSAELPRFGTPARDGSDTSRALVPVEPRARTGVSPWVFVIATVANAAIAAVLAVVITLGMARRDAPPPEAEKVAVSAAPVPEPPREPPAPRLVELLPIGAPGEPLRLEVAKAMRLPLQVRPEEAVQESFILILSGLPAKARLTGASRMGADSWLLPPGALQQIELVVPEWSASVIEVGMELRRTNGTVVAQSMAWLAVPPPQVPEGTKLDESAVKELVRSGDRLLGRGDVTAARALYERAAAMGSAQACLALGSTYDPRRLWSLGVYGMAGNKERARHWYERARQLGHPEAKERIAALR